MLPSDLAEQDQATAHARNAAVALLRFWKKTRGMPKELRHQLTVAYAEDCVFQYPAVIEEDNVEDEDE